jgi:hypothetical protein
MKTTTIRPNQRVRFVHLLDEPRPGTPHLAREIIGATGMPRLRFGCIRFLAGRRAGKIGARAAPVRERAAIPD